MLPAGAPALASTTLDPVSMAALADVAARRGLRLGTVGEGGTAIRLLRATPLPDGQALEVEAGGVRRSLVLPLPGRFQADNALLAAALAAATGIGDVFDRLGALSGVRGRMELAARLANGAAVYVDYAHTPDALERLLTALRPHARGRLHVVFGAGGDRDPGKRPLMGAAAARLADVVVVTDDNPRSEDPAAIRAAVLAGCPGGRDGGDRAAAIASALAALGPGDVLAVAGKGHEQGQTIGGVTLPFDDVATVRRLAGADPFPVAGEGCAVLWTAGDLVEATGGTMRTAFAAGGVSIDTRTLRPGDLFVALHGEARNGHLFVGDALARGAAGALVAWQPLDVAPEAPLLVVDDTLAALQPAGRLRPRAVRRRGGGGDRLGGQDHHQGNAAHHPGGRRAGACRRGLLQQPLGRAADAGPAARRVATCACWRSA